MVRKLNRIESQWLELLLLHPFPGREIIQEQLQEASVINETSTPYISLKLATKSDKRFPYEKRVPAQMLAIQSNGDSIDFILHVIDGYIDELEAYSTDGFEITPDSIELGNIKHNILLNPGDSFFEE